MQLRVFRRCAVALLLVGPAIVFAVPPPDYEPPEPSPPLTIPPGTLGCFKDQGDPQGTAGRDLSGSISNSVSMTNAMCRSQCGTQGFAYAGTQAGSYCFCGNSYGASGPATDCKWRCSGNTTEACGGTWANLVYPSIAPPGAPRAGAPPPTTPAKTQAPRTPSKLQRAPPAIQATPPPTEAALQATIGYTKIDVDIFLPLANARGGLVPMTLKYVGAVPVASLQIPGSLGFPLARPGSFEETIPNMDVRAIMKRDEAAILDRCKGTLGVNPANTVDTVHDAQIPVTLNAVEGTVLASTTVPYQLGLACRNPLSVTIPYTTVELDIAQPLAQAKTRLVTMTVRYNGDGNVASLQIPGSLGLPLAHQGAFDQALPNMDVRAILKRDEAAIVDRCRGTLQFNNTNRIDTSHDSHVPVTVNGSDGSLLGSTTVPYQLGLTCTR